MKHIDFMDDKYKLRLTFSSIARFERTTGKNIFKLVSDVEENFQFSTIIELMGAALSHHHNLKDEEVEKVIDECVDEYGMKYLMEKFAEVMEVSFSDVKES